ESKQHNGAMRKGTVIHQRPPPKRDIQFRLFFRSEKTFWNLRSAFPPLFSSKTEEPEAPRKAHQGLRPRPDRRM
ncbi:MAG: hypothetical protein ACRD5R_08680, partial [Candidatus Acidiferrales bacterium]